MDAENMHTERGSNFGGLLLMMIVVALLVFGMSKANLQMVDSAGRNQELICDGAQHHATFVNFNTAHAWLENIRSDNEGTSYTINTSFTVGKSLILNYICTPKAR
jgi:hypothetical protein